MLAAEVPHGGVGYRLGLELVNKSLVRKTGDGRFALHELVKSYAAEKLRDTPSEEQLARERHYAYYLNFLQARTSALKGGPQQAAALQGMDAELGNIRVAWRYAAETKDEAALEPAILPLMLYHDIRARFGEGEEMFRSAVEGLGESTALVNLLAAWGWFNFRLQRLEASQAACERSLALAERLGAMSNTAFHTLALVYYQQGDRERAERLQLRRLELARQAGELWLVASIVGAAEALCDLGQRERALELLSFALRQEAIAPETERRAERRVLELAAQLPAERADTARQKGRRLHFEDMAKLLTLP